LSILDNHSEAVRALDKSGIATAKMECALRQVISSLETLGDDGWSEAPYLLRECRRALDYEPA
jgi:hypothetical protein